MEKVLTTSIFWLRIAVCFYASGLLYSMLALLDKRTSLYPIARGAFRIGAILQGVALSFDRNHLGTIIDMSSERPSLGMAKYQL
jgi:hypothetical protein